MTSRVHRRRIRKSPADRRAEMVDAAASVALAEGLEGITLRRIGERLDVRPGLVGHYFPVVDELVAEAFGQVVGAELDTLVPPGRAGDTPVERLARFFALATGEGHDALSRLWINARHLSRYRPVLRDRVGCQETQWRGRLEQLIRDGVGSGHFRTADPCASAVQILVVLDGLAAHANTETGISPGSVNRLAAATAERELGLADGTLSADPTQPTQRAHPAPRTAALLATH
ncbi:TetR family transcriptional regulator C-terminal domain-containing protein [Streptomyces sp. NBC_00257]|uniref:TetR/AcrR family transcriptional regulator n=1 Tax=unclassified Streptomyces TaxID=2593676 RepID=UPI00224CFD78|nr:MULTISPECIES: TetR family transcriptional regulator C-terminal domain-containing protein [unclassified Streptomyces]WTB58757.1 TetR family transcriptional regulator C-terminal domain-containing protein [Streptomyces sp. NBC_00826]WTH88366.1 TetR family transcriptional regulator C-terminal domain-containing protein [Streptomyces sp. NBC_00825]WTH97095.1 TetR family transcriptional regulator C-terminal domain-containing protein [Streptomyces sp. NBC_00822]MCX4862586.1 TetR family transcription